MVEVYKTNLEHHKQAKIILKKLREIGPNYRCHVDLEDCDKILRVENPKGAIEGEALFAIFDRCGFKIEVLPDTLSYRNLTYSKSIMEHVPDCKMVERDPNSDIFYFRIYENQH